MIAMLITYCYVSTGECRVEEVGPPVRTWEECDRHAKALLKTMVGTIGDDGSAAIGFSCSVQTRPSD